MPDTQPNCEHFIRRGLLPENLPPIFTSKELWKHFASLGTSYAITAKCEGEHSIFNASRRGAQRRMFGIPHPAFIRDQALFIEKHWPELVTLFGSSQGSASNPTFSSVGRRHVRITSHAELPRMRLAAFSRYKYCLVADVSRFYPSIYTHSIPWAIHGKAQAKLDTSPQSAKVFGNRLDFILRQSQLRQTVGIAVGPDTSKVVSEILMAAVDTSFLRRSRRPKPTFVRHVDDYWVAGNTYEDCEKHLQNLRLALREFELDINENKTKIVSTKLVFGEDWPFEFEKEVSESLKPGSPDGLATLSKIVDRATVNNDEGIIRHAIRKIDEGRFWSRDWHMLQHFLAQCAVQFSHSFDYVARVIAWRHRTSKDIDLALWQDVSNLTIDQNALLGRDSEVVWGLWLLKEIGGKLPKSLSDLILENCGALTLSLLSHFSARKYTPDKDLQSKLRGAVSGNPYSGSYWPLTLEMVHLGVDDPSWRKEISIPALRLLHDNKASIVNWDALPTVFFDDHGNDEVVAEPDFAIEDYGDDYGNGEELNEDEVGEREENHATPTDLDTLIDELLAGNRTKQA
jgi:hypothetical protein